MAQGKGVINLGAELKQEIANLNAVEMCEYAVATDISVISKPTKYGVRENRRMIRNVVVLSLAFVLLFTSYNGMAFLQSSINQTDGLGNWAEAVIYSSLLISALFVPTAFIKKVSTKWTIFISTFGYMIYIAAQLYPTFFTLIPAAAVVGFFAAPLWTAQCSYLTHLGNEYAEFMSEKPEMVIVRFFGLFFMTYHTNGLFGNLISSVVLSSTFWTSETNGSSLVDPHSSVSANSFKLSIVHCGVNYCPGVLTNISEGGVKENNRINIQILAGIYILITILSAIVIGLCLDSLRRYGEIKSETSTKMLLIATFRQMRNKYQLFLIPLTIWTGFEIGFLYADFTLAFITCGWGYENVGYVLISFGLADSISSICYSHLLRCLGQVFTFFVGAALSASLIFTLFWWQPNPDGKIYFFVFAALWGVADAFWQCGIDAYYGVIFKENSEASFSNVQVWESVGYISAFIISNLVCVRSKLYLLLAMLFLGMVGFSLVEICEYKRLNRKSKK